MTITSELVLFFITVMGSLVAVWARIESIVRAARADALSAATAAAAKADTVGTALAEHKLHVAENYVSKVGLREQVGQVMDLLRDVQSDVAHINERIDRVIEGRSRSGQPAKPP
jgi:hypothetical protein